MVVRAHRFAIKAPVRYRPSGEMDWIDGKTENISRSGVLFEGERYLDLSTPIEINFKLPAEIGGQDAEVACRGLIVRTILPPATDAAPSLAAKILDYWIVPGPGVAQ